MPKIPNAQRYANKPPPSLELTCNISKILVLGKALLRPHIHNLQRRILQLNNMSRLQRLRIDIIHIMRMKDARLRTAQYRLFARRIGKPEAPPTRLLRGRTHNCNAFGHHDLIAYMRMQVAGAHEACLCRVCVDPADDEKLFFVAVVEEFFFVERLAGIRCACLFRDDQARYEEGIVLQDAAEHAAGFEVEARVVACAVEELLSELRGKEDGA